MSPSVISASNCWTKSSPSPFAHGLYQQLVEKQRGLERNAEGETGPGVWSNLRGLSNP